MREISEGDKVIDSRDVIKRIEELEDERAASTSTEGTPEEIEHSLTEWDEGEEGEELARLNKLADQGEESPDWPMGRPSSPTPTSKSTRKNWPRISEQSLRMLRGQRLTLTGKQRRKLSSKTT